MKFSAVLVEDAEELPARAASVGDRALTAPDGSTHTDEARVPAKTPAGSTVTVWTDQNEHITAEPLTEEEARLHAVSGGVLAASGAGGAALCAAWVVRLGMERHRMAQWTAEWERINTRKGWKTG